MRYIFRLSHTCFNSICELTIHPFVFVQGCNLQHRSTHRKSLIGYSIIYGACKIRDVIVGVLHCHQDASQVTVKWKLLILNLE